MRWEAALTYKAMFSVQAKNVTSKRQPGDSGRQRAATV